MRKHRLSIYAAMTAMVGLVPASLIGQGPTTSAPQTTPSAESSSSKKPKKQRYSHANDFLVMGTVFDPKGYAFPGVRLKIRRSTEKKYRWQDYTNSRGEFAIRVPQGSEYEMVVHAKRFGDQTRHLDAKSGVSEARLVFRLEPGGGKKR